MPDQRGSELYLIRHGETVNSERNYFNGHFDVELSDKGRSQMFQIAKTLARKPIRAVGSSDLKKASESANMIAKRNKLKVKTIPSLKEVSLEKRECLSLDQINRNFSREIQHRLQNILRFKVDGGKSPQKLNDRVIPVFKGLVSRHTGETIAVVCHGGVNRIILCHLLEIPWKKFYCIKQNFASFNFITLHQKF